MASAVQTPRVGDIGVTPSRGFVAWCIRAITRCPGAAHAFVYIGDGRIVEADPHGARVAKPSNYPRVQWLTLLSEDLTDVQRDQIKVWCLAHLGVPYSWQDDAAIGLTDLFGWAPRFLRDRLNSQRTLMCSQLAVDAYRSVGVDLFPGIPGGAISPGDLWRAEARKASLTVKRIRP